MKNIILNLAKDILRITALEMPKYREFLLEQTKVLNLGKIEYTGVGIYINLNKPKFIDQSVPDGYLSSDSIPTKTLKFDSLQEDFDFIVTCSNGYVDLIEIVSGNIAESWDGKFDTYEFIDN